MRLLTQISLGFAAGSLGALANVAFVFTASAGGLIAVMNVQLPEPLSPAFLFNQIAWGGLWGHPPRSSAFDAALGGAWPDPKPARLRRDPIPLLPPADNRRTRPGLAGLILGTLTPLLVLIANAVLGQVAAWWYSLASPLTLRAAVPSAAADDMASGLRAMDLFPAASPLALRHPRTSDGAALKGAHARFTVGKVRC